MDIYNHRNKRKLRTIEYSIARSCAMDYRKLPESRDFLVHYNDVKADVNDLGQKKFNLALFSVAQGAVFKSFRLLRNLNFLDCESSNNPIETIYPNDCLHDNIKLKLKVSPELLYEKLDYSDDFSFFEDKFSFRL